MKKLRWKVCSSSEEGGNLNRPSLKLISGDREALEQRALKLIIDGSHEEIMACIQMLKPRGKIEEPPEVPSVSEPCS